jgi:hypothetical protein
MGEAQGERVDLEDIRNPDTEFESRDLALRAIGMAALGLLFLIGVSPVALLFGFPGIGTDVNRTLHVLPPQPRLQIDPARDLREELSHQRTLLRTYGWVDRGRQIARVPVTVAMEQLASTGIDGFPKPAPGARP